MTLGESNPSTAFTRIQVLGKVHDILDLFTLDTPELGMKEIRARSGLPASTAARLVHNMTADGLLAERAGRYRIGLAVIRWAAVARQGLGLSEVAAPELRRLREDVGETTGLFVRDGALRVCVALAESTQIVGRRLTLGHVAPLHANAAGKAILAFDADARAALAGKELARFTAHTRATPEELDKDLAEIRVRGYAVSRSEWHDEVAGVGAPVRDAEGQVVASIGVSVPVWRFDDDGCAAIASATIAAAARISAQLGGQPG